MAAQDQVLHHIVLVALEARAVRNVDFDDALLVDGQPRKLAATATALALPSPGPRISGLVHAGGLDLGRSLQTLQARDLLAQGSDRLQQLGASTSGRDPVIAGPNRKISSM